MCYESQGLMMNVQGGVISIGECDMVQGAGRRKRSFVSKFSESSRKRLLRFCSASVARFTTLLTLTIPHVEVSGPIFKVMLDRVLVWLEAQAEASFPGQSWTALWVMEFQGRGAAHIHILLTHPIDKDRVREKWAALWKKRVMELCGQEIFERMRAAACNVERLSQRHHALDYVCRYAGKEEQKTIPSGLGGFGRWWGVRGDRSVELRDCLEVWPLPRDSGDRAGVLDAFARSVMATVAELGRKVRCIRWSRGLGWTILQRCEDDLWSDCVRVFQSVAAALGFVPKGGRADWKDVVRCRLYGVVA